ncbi:MAG: hypothetical protein CMJ83_07220 [Planctomycetes bacterium]|nr:hypothetical protein [Planctomycetota bacterium]
MANTTDVLIREHRIIEKVLECLEVLADRAGTDDFDVAVAHQVIRFVRRYADVCHHSKEEGQLFPALEKKGFDADVGPTATMREEHTELRALTTAMAGALEGPSVGWRHAAFASNARRFAAYLADHIRKEDHCLFPMAATILTEDEHAALVESFRAFEAETFAPGEIAELEELPNELRIALELPSDSREFDRTNPHCCGAGDVAPSTPGTNGPGGPFP